ncbi:MAG: Na/Pi cotransporter family protein [Muribaculaceae bacterium]|nr:Na/Pi cotransporter family protein [Muribaculaceae bacterium]
MDYGLVNFLALLGAVCLFLYGMKIMSEGLQKTAGKRLRSILAWMTKNRFLAIVTGIVITALIQSSSASVSMVVSFVNAGLMPLEQSLAVSFGAALGTTFTEWIIAIFGFKVKMSAFLLPLLAFAVPMLFIKRNNYKNIGELLIGFAFLFMGLDAISANVPDLSKSPEVFSWLQQFTSMGFWSILIFTLVGWVVTMVIQSSAATFAIVLIMASKGWISFDIACAMVLGASIGTSITPLLASLGGNAEAKKAALGHALFNFFGAIWLLAVFHPFVSMVTWVTRDLFGLGDPLALYNSVKGGASVDGNALMQEQVAMSIGMTMFHTIFKICNLLIMIWFTKLYAKLLDSLIKSKKKEDEEFQLKYIQGGLMSASELNILQAQREILVFANRVERMLGMVKELVHTKTGTPEFNKVLSRVEKYEDITDRMEFEIGSYLNKVLDGRLSSQAKARVASLLSIISELESIGDSCNNIAKALVRKEEADAHFNEYNYKNIDEMLKLVSEAMTNMLAVLSDIDNVTAEDLMRNYNKEREINNFRNQCRTENIENVNQKKYPYKAGIFYMDIVCEAEKLGDFIVNVIDSMEDIMRSSSSVTSGLTMGELNPEKTAKPVM